MRLILPNELALNEPLPWDLYDQHGNLLLREGHRLSIARHMESLLLRGAYARAALAQPKDADLDSASAQALPAAPKGEHAREPVYARATRLASSLERWHAELLAGSVRPAMRMQVIGMAHGIEQACRDDADALLAALHTNHAHSYLVVQQLLGAAITDLVAQEAQVDAATRTAWVCAALTRDVELLERSAQRETQTTVRTIAQGAVVRTHPAWGVAMLEPMGVKDSVWLQTARQHGRADSPDSCEGWQREALCEGAKLLAAADAYAAMVTPHSNHRAQLSCDALHTLYLATTSTSTPVPTSTHDGTWVAHMTKSLTMYPPGSCVQLANGERAVVRARASEGQAADVWVVCSADGQALHTAVRRNTAQPAYAISHAVSQAALGAGVQRVSLLWG